MKKLFSIFVFAALTSFACGGASIAFAHSTGTSLELEIGEYLVDAGYSSEVLTVGEPVRFDFNLYKGEERDYADFDNIWARISEVEGPTIFAGGLYKSYFGITGFTIVFPKEGSYELTISYNKEGEELLKTSFPLEVIPAEEPMDPILPIIGISGIIIGAVLGFVTPKYILPAK